MLSLRLPLTLAALAIGGLALAQTPYLSYELNGTYAPTVGSGPSLTNYGGTLGASSYSFGTNTGLSIPVSALPSTSTYTIQLLVTLTQTSAYDRLIDFKDRTSDTGFYAQGGGLNFYGAGSGSGGFDPNVATDVVLVRDGATNEVRGYLDGVRKFTFSDTSSLGVFSATTAYFFMDDFQVPNESHPGFVDAIRIYQGAFSDAQVAALHNPVPEPASLAVLGLGALALLKRRRS